MQCQRISVASVSQIVLHTAAFDVHPWLIIVISVFLRHIPGSIFFHTGVVWEVGVSFISWYSLVDKCLFSLLHVCTYQDGMYEPVTSSDRLIDVHVKHDCSSSSSIYLCCLDEKGNHIAITVFDYKCLEPSIGFDIYFCVCTILVGNEHNIKFMYCHAV